jgi:penicillin-binding protein 1A
VRALVGGRDFADSKFNRATQALRQPGSTFKPIVYAAAIQNGRPPSYIVDDSPVSVPNGDGTDWTPQNYDMKFLGPMPMRRGLYTSRNIIAIKTGMELGPQAIIDEARRFGITSPIPPYPSIYIGSADVVPMELIAGYSAFATLGQRAVPFAIARVENQHGDVLWEPEEMRVPVLSPEEAYLMVSMMKDVNVRGTAAGAVAGAGFEIPSGGKTGTTNDGTDVWYVGYTPDLVAGVWMGFDKPQKIKANAQGGELAAPAWTSFMTEVYRRKPHPGDWPMPSGIVTREIVAGTNMLYSPECVGMPVATDLFIAGTEPVETCVPGQFSGIPGYGVDSLGNPIPPRTDSSGLPAYPPLPPSGSTPVPGRPPRPTVPVDSTADTTGAGGTPRLTPRPPRPVPLPMPGARGSVDTLGRPRGDSALGVPRRPRPLPGDTSRRPPDTLRRTPPDTLRRGGR